MTIVVDTRPSKTSRAKWAKYENVGLEPRLGLEELVLNWLAKDVADLDVYGALTAVELEQTIEGAPTITITLRDPNMRVLSEAAGRVRAKRSPKGKGDVVAYDEGWEAITTPSLIGRAVDVTLDGVTFRLTGVSYSSASTEATLKFEHRLVYWLRRKAGARRASRGVCTRAQFILALVREIRAMRYRFVCPELDVVQPVVKSTTKTTSSSSTAKAGQQTSEAPNALDRVYPRHRIGATGAKRLSERQVRAAGELAGLSPTDALHAAQIAHGESDFYPGVVQDDPGDGMVGHGLWQMTPHAWGGPSSPNYRHMSSLGGLEAMRNPLQAARQMAWMFKQSGNSWRQWYGTRYLDTSKKAAGSALGKGVEADVVSSDEGSAAGGTYVKSYQYARNDGESSWEAIQRLATEVGWRAFVVGNSLYYMSEEALYGRRPRYAITPDDPASIAAVLDLSYDVDWGKPVSECTLQVTLEGEDDEYSRWPAPPGSVITIDGYGPADGRWLVASMRRDYFSPVCEITLRQPGPAKREPASETTTSSKSGELAATEGEKGDASKSAKLYTECKRISDAGGPYVYGGGHGGSLGSLQSGQGLDCSSSSSLALKRAGLLNVDTAQVSGWFASSYGQAGEGEKFTVWANGGHVWIQLKGLGNAWRFDTSPYGSGTHGPRLRTTPRPTSGFTPRHWPGC